MQLTAVPAPSAAEFEVEMDADILAAAIVWAALGIALACLVARLKEPEPGSQPPPRESPAAEIPGAASRLKSIPKSTSGAS